jgi:hypothetical protein
MAARKPHLPLADLTKLAELLKTADGVQSWKMRQAVKRDSARMVANLAAALFGAGVVGRAGLGALRMATPTKLPGSRDMSRQGIQMTIPEEEEEEEDDRAFPKFAELDGHWADPRTYIRSGMDAITHTDELSPTKPAGDYATTPLGVPATIGIGLPLGLASLYGGYKLTDWILDKRRKAEKADELQDVKDDYDKLVRRSFAKHSAAEDLDTLAGKYTEKTAGGNLWKWLEGNIPAPVWNAMGGAGGMLAAYAALSAGAAGKFSYDYFNKGNERVLAEKAMAERQKKRGGGVLPAYVSAAAPG